MAKFIAEFQSTVDIEATGNYQIQSSDGIASGSGTIATFNAAGVQAVNNSSNTVTLAIKVSLGGGIFLYTIECSAVSGLDLTDLSLAYPTTFYDFISINVPFQYVTVSSEGLILQESPISNKNGTVTFTETTGVYSGTNTHGWGTPNPELGDATEASLTIYLPNATTLLPDSTTSVVINLLAEGFPNTDNTPYIITNEDLGGEADTRIPDGIYQFDYLVYVDDTDAYTASTYVLVDSNVNCCIANLAENVDATKCGCGKAASKFEKASLALTAARFAMDCPNITNAAKNLRAAIEICDGCTNC